jgi:hypothetical protein
MIVFLRREFDYAMARILNYLLVFRYMRFSTGLGLFFVWRLKICCKVVRVDKKL